MYLEGLEEANGDPQLLNNLSLCYAHLQRWALARYYAKRAFRADPANVKAAYSLIRAMYKEGKVEAFMPITERVLTRCKLSDAH